MTVLALAAALLVAAPVPAPAAPPAAATPAAPAPAAPGMRTGVPGPDAPGQAADLAVRPPGAASHAGGETRCALCHSAEDWKKVTFSHDRTGFPLTGRHLAVACSACHLGGDFGKPVAHACAACHRDVHGQRLGQRCDRCHDTGSFKLASFGPDDHRRTNFPLTGRHAFIPCDECHGNRRDRAYARETVTCANCHQQDYDQTGTNPKVLNHITAGFPTDCRSCHGAWRFSPAIFADHEACFAIRAGPHAGITCAGCHTGGIPPFVAGQPLSCSPVPVGVPPADCMHCHGNPAAAHAGVPGYAPSNPRCYECHRFTTGLGRRVRGSR